IENYPYPYRIGGIFWEFPCIVPSDWEAQYVHKPANPKTLEDMKAALDCVVLKQGGFDLVFHPHGGTQRKQGADLVGYAAKKHGKKVKFLTFREASERLNSNQVDQPLQGEGGRTFREDYRPPRVSPYPCPLPPGSRLVDEKGVTPESVSSTSTRTAISTLCS